MYRGLSKGRKAQLRATALYLIQSIVEKHEGIIETDLATNTIDIIVPEKEEVACAEEIEEQIEMMYC